MSRSPLLAAVSLAMVLLCARTSSADPLGIEVGWSEPLALADAPIDPLWKEVTFGRYPSNRKLRLRFAYTVPDDTTDVQAAIDDTYAVWVCLVDASGDPYCPLDEDWVIYLDGAVGQKPDPSRVHVVDSEEALDTDHHEFFDLPVDWLPPSHAGWALTIIVNNPGSGQGLQSVEDAVHDNGFFPWPYLLDESADGHFRFYGTEAGTTNPLLDSLGLDLCTDGGHMHGLPHRTTCMGSAELGFLSNQLQNLQDRHTDQFFEDPQDAPTPETWRNGPSPCPPGVFCGSHVFLTHYSGAFSFLGGLSFPPEITVNTGGTVYPLSGAAAFTLSVAAHEYTHAFQKAMCREGITETPGTDRKCSTFANPLDNYPPFVGEPFTEGAADGPWVCIDEYHQGLPSGLCASTARISRNHNRWALREHYDRWLDAPHENLLDDDHKYNDYLALEYISEQFAIPRSLNNPAHPPEYYAAGSWRQTTDSLLPVSDPTVALGDVSRRPDEGHDIRARIAEVFQDAYGLPTAGVFDVALQRHLGRSSSCVMTDLATSLALKDYVRMTNPIDDARFTWSWLGNHNAGASGDHFPLNHGMNVLSLETRKSIQPAPHVGVLPVPWSGGYFIGNTPSPFDYIHRMRREHDTWTHVWGTLPNGTLGITGIEPAYFMKGYLATGHKVLQRHGAMVVSARPKADPSDKWRLRMRVWLSGPESEGRPMWMRLFWIDDATGTPHLASSCTGDPEGPAPAPTSLCAKKLLSVDGSTVPGFSEMIDIPAGSTGVGEVIAVVVSGTNGTSLDWEISSTNVVSSSYGEAAEGPQGIGSSKPSGPLKEPASFTFGTTDSAGEPAAFDSSQLTFRFPGCAEEQGSPDASPCVLAGTEDGVQVSAMPDGLHQVVVTFPDSFYPPAPSDPMSFGLRVEAAGQLVAERSDAFEVRDSVPRTALVLALDESDTMAAPGRVEGARIAAELVLRGLGDEDAAAVVALGRDAFTLHELGSFCDDSTDQRELAVEALAGLDPGGCMSLGDGLLESQSVLAAALDGLPATGPLASCTPERQLLVVLAAGQSEAGLPGYAYYAPPVGTGAPTSDGTEASASCGPDDDPSDNELWYTGELRRPARVAQGLAVPTIAAVTFAGSPAADELHTLVHAAGGRSSLGVATPGYSRPEPATEAALALCDAIRSVVGAAMGYERVEAFQVPSPSPVDMPTMVVEPGVTELLVSIASASLPVDGLLLVSPSEVAYAPSSASVRAAVFRIADPEAGAWSFTHVEPFPEPPLRGDPAVFVEHSVRSPLRLFVTADSLGRAPLAGQTGQYESRRYVGADVVLRAVIGGAPIEQATVVAEVTMPGGRSTRVGLYDDGQHGDGAEGDGIFAATFRDTTTAGTYQVRFRAQGSSAVTGGGFARDRLVAFALHDGADSDEDGLPDWWEERFGGDLGGLDAEGDPDRDGLANIDEFFARSNPRASDSDGGGESDGSEIARGADPNDDSDDSIWLLDPIVAAGNAKVLVGLSVPLLVDAFVEIERGPSARGPFQLVFGGELAERGSYSDSAANDLTACYRSRTSFGETTSGWSVARCVVPRVDPDPPAVELSVPNPPAPGATEALVRVFATDLARSGLLPSTMHPLPALRDPDAVASGVSDMLVSTRADFADTDWVPLADDVVIPLGDPEFTPVFAKVRDAAGNESGVGEVVVSVFDPWPTEAVVGFERVELDPHAVVAGSVAVIYDDEAPLPGGAELILGAHAELQGDARASGVLLGQDTLIAGILTYDEVEGLGLVGGELRQPLATPVPLRLPVMPTIATEGPHVTVGKNESRVLDPGSYGVVALQGGNPNKRAVLRLSGGTYGMRSLTLGDRARVECASACTVLIAEELLAHDGAEIGPASSDILGAQVGFFVAATDDGADASVRLGPQANIHGRVIAPSGMIWLQQGTAAMGTFFGKRVRVGPGATVTKDGG